MAQLSHCLWFDDQAEDAARFYVSLFPDGKLGRISRYCEAGFDVHGRPAGSVMTVEFELAGVRYAALNGGPLFPHSEAFSFVVDCESQDEIDSWWERLLADGGRESHCGWLKDRFGVSWQVTPSALKRMLLDPDPARVARVTSAFLQMRKFDLAALEAAFAG